MKELHRQALATELRTMIDLLHDTDPDEHVLADLVAETRAGNARLASVGGTRWEPPDGRRRWNHFSVFRGDWNPLAPPMHVTIVAEGDPGGEGRSGNRDHVEGRVTIPSACEGPPGTAHGGVVAGLLDELLGVATTSLGRPGVRGVPAVTGRLEVRYRAPTPLDAELRLIATISDDRGWRVSARAEAYAGEVCTAEATGLFLRPALRGRT